MNKEPESPTNSGPTGGPLVCASPNAPAPAFPSSDLTAPAQSSSVGDLATPNANNNITTTTGTNNALGTPGYAPYGGGMSPYGYGMDPYGLGMGGMGMGMGLGMGMGMGMYGMTPEAQRSQMMMFMIGRIMELWTTFSQVIQMAFGSVFQFFGNYVNINQKLTQIEQDEIMQYEQFMINDWKRTSELKNLPPEPVRVRRQPSKLHKKPSFVRRLIIKILWHATLALVAYFLTKRITGWYNARKARRIMEEAAQGQLVEM